MRNDLLPSAAAAVLAATLIACGKPNPAPPTNQAPTQVRVTYRAIAGVSMGAIGASVIGLRHPDRFDAIAALGGPFDRRYLLRYFEGYWTGGFCTRAELEALLANNPGNPDILNDPSALGCMKPRAPEVAFEHGQGFNALRFTANGGSFDRSEYLNMFRDLSLAFGNPAYHNAESPFAPGTTARDASPKGIDPEVLRRPPADLCANPRRISKLYNAEYNPEGRYDAITFCDGEEWPVYFCVGDGRPVDFCARGPAIVARAQERAFAESICGAGGVDVATRDHRPDVWLQRMGVFEPCREHTRVMPMLLAFDYNGNGRRDYGEPIAVNGRERFDDVGVDGCPSTLEDGKGGCVATAAESPSASGTADPNGDDYEALARPAGTEKDWEWQAGEPYRDDGLDGVPGTGDFGEANGAWDESPNRRRWREMDPRTNLSALPSGSPLRVYLDGGIRDVFNFGVMARELYGAVRARSAAEALMVERWVELPAPRGDWGATGYDGYRVRWSEAPRNVFVAYGDPQASDPQKFAGDGDHVGTPEQALNRFFTMAGWVASGWKLPHVPAASPTPTTDRIQRRTYASTALAAEREYGLYLPPGYEDPANAGVRYPVLYVLHGYGMEPAGPDGFVQSSPLLFEMPMLDPEVRMTKMIVVFANGLCCFRNATTGERSCTEVDAAGTPYWNRAGWERECASGSFYVDSAGYRAGEGLAYEKAFFELMEHVDATLRTMPAESVPAR